MRLRQHGETQRRLCIPVSQLRPTTAKFFKAVIEGNLAWSITTFSCVLSRFWKYCSTPLGRLVIGSSVLPQPRRFATVALSCKRSAESSCKARAPRDSPVTNCSTPGSRCNESPWAATSPDVGLDTLRTAAAAPPPRMDMAALSCCTVNVVLCGTAAVDEYD